ncbi:MAG: asparagine synthase (glutamine-hydrolyzing) [Acidobacteria bacterium]|nr:asparagine synthase (glutamine-hydrolyzing) [Acidobacteriota bacterium]
MCGICGCFNVGEATEPIRRMCEAMIPRGPDSSGFYANGAVALGMRRLSIIDLSTGEQPIFNEDGDIAIVFNGEIFNYRELTRELIALGHHFKTHSDTEAIVHAYEQWGTECPRYLRGQFAFLIHDMRPWVRAEVGPQGKLFAARDRLGIKPLYYAPVQSGFVLASEIKALLASSLVAPRMNPSSLLRYLKWGFIPGPETILEGVQLLPAGHTLVIDGRGARESCYWSPKISSDSAGNLKEVVERIRSQLADAVKAEMTADVPVGAFLSGGLDSSVLVALMSRFSGGDLRTFSISFNEGAYSEAAYARSVARQLGTNHHDCRVTASDVLKEFPKFIAALDQPSTDGLNTYFVSKFTHESGAKVALSGLGGDELFGGYSSFRQLPLFSRLIRLLHVLPGSTRAAQLLTETENWDGARRKLNAALEGEGSIGELFAIRRGLFLERERARLLAPEWLQTLNSCEATTLCKSVGSTAGAWNQVSLLEMSLYMREQLLRDTDCLAMAHSLEVRVPLIDYLLVEYVLSVPEHLKNSGKGLKPLLLEAARNLVPEEVRQRSKQGFVFPLAEWLRGELKPLAQEVLFSPPSELFRSDALNQLWHGFLHGEVNHTRIWGLVVLLRWLDQHGVQPVSSKSNAALPGRIYSAQPKVDTKNHEVKRVLVYKLGSIGDTVVALPCFHLIARVFPRAERRLLTARPVSDRETSARSVLGDSGLIHNYFLYPAGTRDVRELFLIWRQLRKWRPQLMVYLMEPRSLAAAWRDFVFFKLCGIPRIMGTPLTRGLSTHRRLNGATYESEAARLARCLSGLGDARLEEAVSWDLILSSRERNEADAALKGWNSQPFIACNAGAKVDVKDWGEAKWSILLRRLGERCSQLGLVMLGASAEAERAERLRQLWPAPSLNLCGRISPRVSAAVIERSTLYLGHDGGPMHLAAAVGTPCVAIFSARSKPGVWFPRGSAHSVIYHQTHCHGCSLSECAVYRKQCIESITPEEVLAACEQQLGASKVTLKAAELFSHSPD